MMKPKIFEGLISVADVERSGSNLVLASLGVAEFERIMKDGRKVNTKGDSKNFARYQLTVAECAKRGVRFLPMQVMRPIFATSNL